MSLVKGLSQVQGTIYVKKKIVSQVQGLSQIQGVVNIYLYCNMSQVQGLTQIRISNRLRVYMKRCRAEGNDFFHFLQAVRLLKHEILSFDKIVLRCGCNQEKVQNCVQGDPYAGPLREELQEGGGQAQPDR